MYLRLMLFSFLGIVYSCAEEPTNSSDVANLKEEINAPLMTEIKEEKKIVQLEKKIAYNWDYPILEIRNNHALNFNSEESFESIDSTVNHLDSIKSYLKTDEISSFDNIGLVKSQSLIGVEYFRGECNLGQLSFKLEHPVSYGILFPNDLTKDGRISFFQIVKNTKNRPEKYKNIFIDDQDSIHLELKRWGVVSDEDSYEVTCDSTLVKVSVLDNDGWNDFDWVKVEHDAYTVPKYIVPRKKDFLVIWSKSSYLGETIFFIESFNRNNGTSNGVGRLNQGGFSQPCCL